jgi:hypothetical protein
VQEKVKYFIKECFRDSIKIKKNLILLSQKRKELAKIGFKDYL